MTSFILRATLTTTLLALYAIPTLAQGLPRLSLPPSTTLRLPPMPYMPPSQLNLPQLTMPQLTMPVMQGPIIWEPLMPAPHVVIPTLPQVPIARIQAPVASTVAQQHFQVQFRHPQETNNEWRVAVSWTTNYTYARGVYDDLVAKQIYDVRLYKQLRR